MRYANLIRRVSDWPNYFRYKYGGWPPEAVFRLRGGGGVKIPRQSMVEFKQSFFEDLFTGHLARPVAQGGDVLDVGAHIGCFTVYAATQLPCDRTFAFEPDLQNFALLEENAALNPQANIVTVKSAVGPINGTLPFFNEADSEFSTSGTLDQGRGEGRGYIESTVDCMTLETAFETYQIARCSLLKLNCEGAEYDIFEMTPDSILDRVDQIVVQMHDLKHKSPQDGMDLLAKRGFKTTLVGNIAFASRP